MPMPTCRCGAERGFSLIELLVVVSLIALLVGVLLPALAAARGAGRDAVCKSQVRQVFAAEASYELDAGRFTDIWQNGDPTPWKQRLSGHLNGTDPAAPHGVYHCPDATRAELDAQPTDPALGRHASSIGLNGAMRFDEWRFDSANVPNPAHIIGLGEQAVALYETLITSDGFGVWSTNGFTSWYGTTNHDPHRGFRHPGGGGANFARMDGHVVHMTTPQLYRESGHWYWFDALDGDTAVAGAGIGPIATMPAGVSPNPTPAGVIGPFAPRGPLTAPCGCPL